jgi:hypothetical protein
MGDRVGKKERGIRSSTVRGYSGDSRNVRNSRDEKARKRHTAAADKYEKKADKKTERGITKYNKADKAAAEGKVKKSNRKSAHGNNKLAKANHLRVKKNKTPSQAKTNRKEWRKIKKIHPSD